MLVRFLHSLFVLFFLFCFQLVYSENPQANSLQIEKIKEAFPRELIDILGGEEGILKLPKEIKINNSDYVEPGTYTLSLRVEAVDMKSYLERGRIQLGSSEKALVYKEIQFVYLILQSKESLKKLKFFFAFTQGILFQTTVFVQEAHGIDDGISGGIFDLADLGIKRFNAQQEEKAKLIIKTLNDSVIVFPGNRQNRE